MTNSPAASPSIISRFLHHLIHMPAWHRYVLIAAVALGGVGLAGQIRQWNSGGSAPAATAATPPAGASGAFATTPDASTANTAPDANTTPDANTPPWYLSPKFLGVGGSVVVGFIVGWLLRVFVKTTLMIGALLGLIIGGLSYFHVINVDFTRVQQQYSSDVSWMTDQLERLGQVAIAYLPVHAGGVFGMFMGFRRNKLRV
jgi:uncharacterized membrane protein (Fun14 family)